jgi:hypothetical protein
MYFAKQLWPGPFAAVLGTPLALLHHACTSLRKAQLLFARVLPYTPMPGYKHQSLHAGQLGCDPPSCWLCSGHAVSWCAMLCIPVQRWGLRGVLCCAVLCCAVLLP